MRVRPAAVLVGAEEDFDSSVVALRAWGSGVSSPTKLSLDCMFDAWGNEMGQGELCYEGLCWARLALGLRRVNTGASAAVMVCNLLIC